MIEKVSFLGFSLRTRQRRRLFVLAYYAVLLGLLSLGILYPRLLAQVLVSFTFVLGGLLGGIKVDGPVKPYSASAIGGRVDSGIQQLNLNGRRMLAAIKPLDERETMERDRAHYIAYRLLCAVIGIALALCFVAFRLAPRFLLENAFAFLWCLAVFAMSLPQSVILWTEPEPLPEYDLTLVPDA